MLSLPGRLRRPVLVVAVVGLTAAAVLVAGPSSADVQHAVRAAGWYAPLAFVALYVVLTLLLVPGTIPTVAAGALFGGALGSALAIVGATLGAVGAFLIGRWVGRRRVQRLLGPRAAQFDDWFRRRGFVTVLTARLIPLVPFSLFNYAAGVTGVSLRAYAPATLLGIVPGTVAYTTLGGSLHHPASAPFLASITAIVLLAAVVILRERRHRRAARLARNNGEAPRPVPVAS